MTPPDTDPEIQRILDGRYRRMTPAERGEAVRGTWRTARTLQLAGLRTQFPGESEEALERRLAERWLGPELYRRVIASMTESDS